MKETEKYIHHNVEVSVISSQKGEHSQRCLCYNGCVFFKPGTPENCPIAQGLYEYDIANHVTTPVFECHKYDALQ